MALANYTDLKNSIEDWSKRHDVNTLLDDFIDIAEAEMWKMLRIRDMEARATASATTRFLALPTDFIEMRRLKLTSGSNHYELQYDTPETIKVSGTSGRPQRFTVTTQLEFDRTPDSTYTVEMQYYKKLTALSSSNTTSAILTNHPMCYLFGSLWALHTWARDEGQADYYYSRFMTAVDSANSQYKRGRYGPAPQARVEGSTP